MSGHNRWSKIKHKKEASDAKKSKVWTKVIKEITVSARVGGGDINGNPRLRAAVDKARGVNMPNDTIDRAIKKGTGDLDGVQYEEFNYEVFGPGGTAILVEVMTDNRNQGESLVVVTDPKEFERIRDGLKAAGLPEPLSAEVTMVPQNMVRLQGKEAEGAVKLVSALEDHDDVQNVYSNMDVDDAVLESVG